MAYRTTRKDMEGDWARTMALFKLPTGAKLLRGKRRTPGNVYSREHVRLDYNPIYGGYQPMVVMRGSGETYFDRQTRMSPQEMKAYLYGLRKGAELKRRGARKKLLTNRY